MLVEFCRAYDHTAFDHDEKVHFENVMQQLYPAMLETLSFASQGCEKQLQIMYLCCKAFKSAHNVSFNPWLLDGNNMDNWVNCFCQILQTDMGALETSTNDPEQISRLNKEKGWKLKGIVTGTAYSLFSKYGMLLNTNRYRPGKAISQESKVEIAYMKHFESYHMQNLIQSCIQLVLNKKEKFVGATTLFNCTKIIYLCVEQKQIRKRIRDNLEMILTQVPLMLMQISPTEAQMFNEDQIEFIRFNMAENTTKHEASILLRQLCKVQKSKNQQHPDFLPTFIQMVGNCLTGGADEQTREVIYFVLGKLSEQSRQYSDILGGINQLCINFAHKDIMNDATPDILKQRALWFMSYLTDQDGLTIELVNKVFNLMHSSGSLAVKIEAAQALAEIVNDQPSYSEVIKPALQQVLETFLQLMDEIELEGLISALKIIVDNYEKEIIPFAT